jgi:CubicO group peptidase (beta-lactamase class C family)
MCCAFSAGLVALESPSNAAAHNAETLTSDSMKETESIESPGHRIQSILDAAVNEGLMAVTAYVSWEGGYWAGVAGATSADSMDPLSPDSPFWLASITKLFTATIICNSSMKGLCGLMIR